jgi:hypothetical protein
MLSPAPRGRDRTRCVRRRADSARGTWKVASRRPSTSRESSFFEQEIAHSIERFGHIAHVFSTYAAHSNEGDEIPVMRGINSIQVVNHGARCWIANLVWDLERPTNPIPQTYLPN